jgi:predicted PhzF superfamily epimerase YddE/YHI9
MGQPIMIVDAFTNEPFGGNPAAVCLLEAPAETGWMRDVAREMNLSETAFLHPAGDGYNLRWFTPAVEVDLCGHATLASAHVLWEEGVLPPGDTAVFHTRSGRLTAQRGLGAGPFDEEESIEIEMDFPAYFAVPADPPPSLLEALGAEALYVGRSRFDYMFVVE